MALHSAVASMIVLHSAVITLSCKQNDKSLSCRQSDGNSISCRQSDGNAISCRQNDGNALSSVVCTIKTQGSMGYIKKRSNFVCMSNRTNFHLDFQKTNTASSAAFNHTVVFYRNMCSWRQAHFKAAPLPSV